MLRTHSSVIKKLLILATLSTLTSTTIITLKPEYPMNTALGISRHSQAFLNFGCFLCDSGSILFPQNMPRRRVSVAVVPKFNILNLPGQSPSSSPIPSLPALVSIMMLASQAHNCGGDLDGAASKKWGNSQHRFCAIGYRLRNLSIDQAPCLALPREEDIVSLTKVLATQRVFLAKCISLHA